MANFSGNDTKLQLGLETTWGTSVTPTLAIPFLSESLKETHNPVESEALVGAVTTPYFSIIGRKVEGDMEMQVHPDNIGLLLYAALGVEASTSTVTTGVYSHAFTPVSGGTSLPHLSAVVDKKADEFTYTSLKVDSMSLDTSSDSLLTSSFSFVGQKEQIGDQSIQALSVSSLAPFDFNDMKIYWGTAGSTATTNLSVATSFSFSYANNLENDLFVADGTEYMTEIDYQKRDITFDIEALYDSDTNTMREDYFKTGDTISMQIAFTHPSTIVTGQYYSITIDMLNVVVTDAPNDISGPDRLRVPFSFRALEVGSDEAITVTVQDGQSTKYSA